MDYVKEMIKFFNEMARTKRMQPHTLFSEMIELTYDRQKSLPIHHRKIKADEVLDFSLLFAGAMLNNPFRDVLGEVLHELNAANKKGLGQCMTPPDISYLLGKLASRYKAQNQHCFDGDELKIGDDCGCGTGALVLTQLEHLNLSEHKKVLVRFVDIHEVMLKAAYLQINANIALHMSEDIDFKLMPICANTLTLQY
ncbi:hypothetical protein OTK51_13205 [Vibrio scophthalmi]|uniref:hypothetical protein n=1 Tax=Vibrio scophthalmi TaxID=45658 RepID=UPI002284B3C7|nr:hypothetical protein [Vibrio scophthalmi]MCY9804385.1 hypothetical protein [Vibrio scophthalmi]